MVEASLLTVNPVILHLISDQSDESVEYLEEIKIPSDLKLEYRQKYVKCTQSIYKLSKYLERSIHSPGSTPLSIQRNLLTLINCQLLEAGARLRAVKAARQLGHQSCTELILFHQNLKKLATKLWEGVEAHEFQFLGPG